MNLLKGKVAEGGGVEVSGSVMKIAGSHQVKPGQAVIFGVRPEHLELSPDGFPAQISVVEPMGSEMMVFLHFGEHELVALFRERHEFKPGETIHLRPRAEEAHLFDAETGKRL
jgi:multiple sugar transport system ATP-binding protein